MPPKKKKDKELLEETVPKQLNLWKKQRALTKTNASNEVNKCQALLDDPEGKEQALRVSQRKLQDYCEKLRQYNDQILPHVSDDEIDAELQDCDEREQLIDDSIFRVDAYFAARDDRPSSNPVEPASGRSESEEKGTTKLPKLQIEPFSGDTLKWREFWDTFDVTVHSRKSLSQIEKFQYLKSFLRDDAQRIISGYALSDATYQTAVAALKERYDHPELCINVHLDAMIYMKECQNTVADMQKTFDECEANIRGLEALGMAEETFERVFAPLMLSKFPRFVRVELNRKNGSNAWTLANLRQYIKDEIAARQLGMQTVGTSGERPPGKDKDPRNQNRKPKSGGSASGLINSGKQKKPPDKQNKKYPCAYCQSDAHLSENCDKYITAKERRGALKSDQCILCLGKSHRIAECRSKRACKYCGATGSHHHSLCFKQFGGGNDRKSDQASGLNADAESFVPAGSLLAPASSNQQPNRGSAILGTALAKVKGLTGTAKVRIVLDSCSTRSFGRLDALKTIGAKKIADEHLGLAGLAADKRQYDKFGCYELTVICPDGDKITIAVNGLNSVTCPVDRQPLCTQDYPLLKQFVLADPPEKQRGSLQLDILIGLDQYYRFVGHIAVRLSDTLVLLDTKLGYVVNGSVKPVSNGSQHGTALLAIDSSSIDNTLNENLERLWELEDVGIAESKMTADEIAAVEKFEKGISYDSQEKRYSVRWPWKENRRELPDNYGLAFGRLKSLLKRIDEPTLKVYNDTIADQFKKGVIEVAPNNPSGEDVHYIPHHCVVRPDSTTTKVRIVYDASAKSSKTSPSLNDCMYPGPVILADLCGLLIRFRQGKVGVISDIEKAFLQVRLKPEDRDVTRFLWVKDIHRGPNPDNLVIFRFTSVPFGVTSSPYMLAGTIKHHLSNVNTPVAHQILSNCYVDNVITCVDTTSEAVAYYNTAKQLFNSASMNLREWYSNDEKFMICIDDADQGAATTTTVLGMKWNKDTDTLSCRSKIISDALCRTKRELLQAIAQVFDPCGLVSPITITGKIMMQSLWKEQLRWDDELTSELQTRANAIVENLKSSVSLSVPRHIGNFSGAEIQLHCFVDASKLAYAAVLYQRTTCLDGSTHSSLFFAKAKVAPANNQLTIPKLELSAVDLGGKILQFVASELQCPVLAQFIWSDSMCSIQWVKGDAKKPVFVKNRVERIRKIDKLQIRYVPTAENPADIPTKGMTTKDLKENVYWWYGPAWLAGSSSEWPKIPDSVVEPEEVEETPTVLIGAVQASLPICVTEYSSIDRAIHVLAWVRRFIANARKLANCRLPFITASERATSLQILLQNAQQKFALEQAEEYLSALKQLHFFVDPSGLIRCKGRIENSSAPYDTCCPIFVPRNLSLSVLIIDDIHQKLGHAGVAHVLSELRSHYWIPRARTIIKKQLANCRICKRWKGGPFRTPEPPSLPAFRVAEKPSFSMIGLDYAGPLYVRQRGGERSKVWICLFTCCSTRAIHLEVVTDMTANQFLMALRRFIAFRRIPELIVCDNAKQFRLASKTTDDLWRSVVSHPSVQEFSTSRHISWKFIVEFAPWMGGMYERMVGLTKKALRCMLQNMLVDTMELQTLCVEVSAILNCRPLTYCEDQVGYKVLTPNHLQSHNDNLLPTTNLESLDDPEYNPSPDSKSALILRWKRLEARLSEFWKVWQKDYLTSLNHRHWQPNLRGSSKEYPKIGSVVLIADPVLPRGQWLMGRIEQLCQSSADNQIRAVIIKTAAGKRLRRPLKLVHPLEIADAELDSHDEAPKKPISSSEIWTKESARPKREAAKNAARLIKKQVEEEDANESDF